MKRTTLHDVARAAGVSHMTVSRVVRGVHNVSPATAQKVRQIVARLKYRPDPALSALAYYRHHSQGRRGTSLAFLDCDGTAYSRVVFEGVQREARLLGYGVERFNLDLEKDARRLNRILFHRGMRGLLFGPSDTPRKLEGWDWPHFTAVSLGALSHTPRLHAVASDYFHGMMTACQQLHEAGFYRLGLAVEERYDLRTEHRWLGGFAAWNGNVKGTRSYAQPLSASGGLLAWSKREDIDAVLTIHPEVYRCLHPAGVKVVFLSDFNDIAEADRLCLDPRELGVEGVRLSHHLLLRQDFGLPDRPKAMLLQARWAPYVESARKNIPAANS